MFAGMKKRIISLWFPRLHSDRILRRQPMTGPFAVTAHAKNTDRLLCVNQEAQSAGLERGMSLSDAHALCPSLRSEPHHPQADQYFLSGLSRWARRYCPWVAQDGGDGLLMDITGSAHLFGGEEAMLNDLGHRLGHARLHARWGVADTRGAAWALAHYRPGIATMGDTEHALNSLPVAALRIAPQEDVTLQRLGVKTIGQLTNLPRATLGQRFGASVLMRLDQALGTHGETISPEAEAPVYATRLTFPEPIGLSSDVMAALDRLLPALCAKLRDHQMGARTMLLICRRVDGQDQQVELRLARPLRDSARIKPLFERGVGTIDAGFGIDQLRLVATQVEHLAVEQISHHNTRSQDGLHDLITRLGNRIGLDNIQRFLPADSHIPERSFKIAAAAWSEPRGTWVSPAPRPIRIFPPEGIAAAGNAPPKRFRWRRQSLATARATGPERIAPEWWFIDENWRSGVRDYWRIETQQGRRLWMFYTPQNPGWFIHGEFA